MVGTPPPRVARRPHNRIRLDLEAAHRRLTAALDVAGWGCAFSDDMVEIMVDSLHRTRARLDQLQREINNPAGPAAPNPGL
jgi:hypothetical protein